MVVIVTSCQLDIHAGGEQQCWTRDSARGTECEGQASASSPSSDLEASTSSTPKGIIGKQQFETELPSWTQFCHDFLLDTYHKALPMCGEEEGQHDQVKCYGNVYTKHLALCSFENLALKPSQMIRVIPNDVTFKTPPPKTINLLQSTDVDCKNPSLQYLSAKTDRDDLQLKLTAYLMKSEKLSMSACDVWINKTTFFHVSNALHIYFRFLDLYSLHKALIDYSTEGDDVQVLRIGGISDNYCFPKFDKQLFPGAMTLSDLPAEKTVCFKKVVFSPRSYQSIPFRCKMEGLLRSRCFECDGRGLTGSPMYTFRTRVLKACNITENNAKKTSRVVIVSRKPYQRWSTDEAKNFQRVLLNEDEMVSEIRNTFPDAIVDVAHMEDLGICEQVRYAVEADVMLGVHGAGLVHFWWLRDGATGIELEPTFQVGNPSFRMLTKLTGRNYVSHKVVGFQKGVTVAIDQVLKTLKDLLE